MSFVEYSLIDEMQTIGEEIVLRIISPCTHRVMSILPQVDLPQNLGILRTVHDGVYASVHLDGTIRRGDNIQLDV